MESGTCKGPSALLVQFSPLFMGPRIQASSVNLGAQEEQLWWHIHLMSPCRTVVAGLSWAGPRCQLCCLGLRDLEPLPGPLPASMSGL